MEEKKKQLETVLKNINKHHGKGAITLLGNKEFEKVKTYSTGSLTIDKALGVKGIPRGRIIEIYGPESSGKTTLSLQILAQVQKEGGVAAFIDAEHAMDPEYAENLGCKIDDIIVSQPDNAEQALQITEELTLSGLVNIIVIDSVAALVPKAEIDGEIGDVSVGLQARLMSQALRKLATLASKNDTIIIFINQIRMKIGMMGYGSPETTSGGNALKFYSSVRIDVRRIQSLKKGEEVIGNKIKVKIVKNKVAAPFKIAETKILFGKGISVESEVLDLAVKNNIVDKAGSWFSYIDKKLGQGEEKVLKYFEDNPDIYEEIKQKVLEVI